MEIIKNNIKTSQVTIDSVLTLSNRQLLNLSGVKEIISSSESDINLLVGDEKMCITGNNLHITKLDVERGDITATGTFNSIKYGVEKNFMKRIFK